MEYEHNTHKFLPLRNYKMIVEVDSKQIKFIVCQMISAVEKMKHGKEIVLGWQYFTFE